MDMIRRTACLSGSEETGTRPITSASLIVGSGTTQDCFQEDLKGAILKPYRERNMYRGEGVAIVYCGVKRFRQLIMAGADGVMKNRDQLNKINVFPVPDGDTGSNMSMTLASAVREMEAVGETSLDATVKAAAWGALMGARGNSGIILSQILSGLTDGIEGRERLFAEDIVHAFSRGVKKAYKAVLHPAEGTILTVVRETAEAAEQAV